MSSDLATIISDIQSQITGDGIVSICISRDSHWVEVADYAINITEAKDGELIIVAISQELDEAIRIANGIKDNTEKIDYE